MNRSLADTPIDRLARFISDLDYGSIPESVVAKTKVHIADTLGAAIAGARSQESASASQAMHSAGSTRLWGTGLTGSPRDSAFINGVAAHAFELDDAGGCDHSGAVIMPAVFSALHEIARPVDGKRMITAVVAGYDAGRRILEATGGYDAHNGLGWHSTGTCGTFAAAAAVANLLGLDASATRDAMTLSTSFSSGLWAFIHDGSQAKKLHAGRAAEGGLLAALLAAKGFAGPSRVFDDVWGGFFTSFNKSACQPDLLSEGLGDVWKVNRAVLKPYASCRGAHSAVDALEDLLDETGRVPQEIARIGLRMSGMLANMCGAKVAGAMAPTQMSLPFALAARCVFGTAGLQAYTEERRQHPDVQAVMERIDISVDASMDAMAEPVVTLTFRDGFIVERMVPRATGSAERPMPAFAVAAKFRELATMSLPEDQVETLWQKLGNLEQIRDCTEIETLMSGHAETLPTFR
ncbi:MmgE/PrpD family protein [Neorhizobium galegae]|uniref:MmgE/PrpD family protein n=1 Tax=Neorhizobium galegae TaxID=399 RepID=UPI0006223BE7|nr:MmgE/PrpD family protein [Neorhizobium galegae]KAB1122085.1 MmgE/PrpD family protein [Neorhizobium galegae]MCQ1810533.1 MmgE/PrpD family protein [Neorhizobium galegae]CDZ62085.1 MmgE/PrpD family protein [Neorhizobium galegae bv. orientalis]